MKEHFMTPGWFRAQMRDIAHNGDPTKDTEGDEESAHVEADKLMCDVLRFLGYDEGVDIFEEMPRWYA